MKIKNADHLGAAASTLCLIHCAITPFIFVVQSCSISCCKSSPAWWKWIDYLCLVISCIAVYASSKTIEKKWVKSGLWLSWTCLLLILINEKKELVNLPQKSIYIAAIALTGLHIYNKMTCTCETPKNNP